MSTLQDFLEKNQIKPATFATRLSISRGALHDLLTDRRKPSLVLAKRISEATMGAVPMEAWVEAHCSQDGNSNDVRKGRT